MTMVYVGSRTSRERNARGDGISVFRLDDALGTLEPVQVVGGLVNPSYLALHPRGHTLYSVHGDQQEISALHIHPQDGSLQFLQRQHCGGKNPVHLALDPTGQYVVVSNHLSSNLAVLPLLPNGELGPVSQTVALDGPPGPHRVEQPFAKPHFNPFDPSGQFVLVPDKGLDRVFSFQFANGQLVPAESPWVGTRESAGPRHIAFHPGLACAYVANELDSTVTGYRLDTRTGQLTPMQVLPTLPDTFTGNNRVAGIAVSGDGCTLYVSNRGHDSVAVFRLDRDTGRMTWVEATLTQGRTPRFFALSPSGRQLFALNEDSDSIVALAVQAGTGRLSVQGAPYACGSPVCMVFLRASPGSA
jgi:6-phosphogluconolactonase (cycloisomerase 2 family)